MKIKYESKEIILKIEKKTNAAIHIQDLMSGQLKKGKKKKERREFQMRIKPSSFGYWLSQPIALLLYFFLKKRQIYIKSIRSNMYNKYLI